MLKQLVVAGLLFLRKRQNQSILVGIRSFFFLVASCFCLSLSVAQSYMPVEQNFYVARIELHTAEELMSVLTRSSELFDVAYQSQVSTVVFLLHGPEARIFFRESYHDNRALVDLAAKLTALKVVEIKVCETWMGSENLDRNQLLPFVGTVPYGPAAESYLINKKSYNYF